MQHAEGTVQKQAEKNQRFQLSGHASVEEWNEYRKPSKPKREQTEGSMPMTTYASITSMKKTTMTIL
jgi:hypothetical protein